jgi:hypothetical protein
MASATEREINSGGSRYVPDAYVSRSAAPANINRGNATLLRGIGIGSAPILDGI